MKPALIMASLTVAAAAVTNPASALHINQHATGSFQALYGSDAQYINNSLSAGVYNTHTTSSKYITGGLVRNPSSTQTVYFFANFLSSSASMTCYVYGYNYDGTLVDSDTVTFTSSYGSAVLTGLPSYGVIGAYCLLPPSGAARLFAYAVVP